VSVLKRTLQHGKFDQTFHLLFLILGFRLLLAFLIVIESGYGTTHGSSYFKTYSTAPPHMTQFKQSSQFVAQAASSW